jgi:YHS domain-containing protein
MGRLLMYLVDTIILLVISALVGRILGDLFGGKRVGAGGTRVAPPPGRSGAIIQGETARDPVCGTFVAVELSHKLREGAKTLHFCSDECLESYQKAHADG